jgi:hypothetical protein
MCTPVLCELEHGCVVCVLVHRCAHAIGGMMWVLDKLLTNVFMCACIRARVVQVYTCWDVDVCPCAAALWAHICGLSFLVWCSQPLRYHGYWIGCMGRMGFVALGQGSAAGQPARNVSGRSVGELGCQHV